jgi:glycosyltransferase involved in cell wall biosynthesis
MNRILYLSRGGNIGGSQKQLEYLVEDMQQDFVPVVACTSKGPFVDSLKAKGIATHVMPLRPWRKLGNMLSRYLDARRMLRFARANQVALIHGSDLWLSGYMLRAARKLGVPAVLHVRTPVTPQQVRKHRFAEATAIVAISRRVRRNLVEAGIAPQRITLIDDAIDVELFRPTLQRNNILRREFPHGRRFQVGLVGHIRPAKKQLEFLLAIEHFCRITDGNATFFIIGEVHSQTYQRELFRFITTHHLEDRVIFTGNRMDMPEVLNSLDVLVSLSGGSVMFEGMACGKCVVSAGFTSGEDAVHLRDGETGILLDSQQPEMLATVLRSLLENPQLRADLGRRARQWVEKKLDRRQMTASMQRLYADLLKTGLPLQLTDLPYDSPRIQSELPKPGVLADTQGTAVPPSWVATKLNSYSHGKTP